MLVVHERFLHDLQASAAPPQVAAPDTVLLAEMPKAIVDLDSMISAARSGDKGALVQATTIYVDEMETHITDALAEPFERFAIESTDLELSTPNVGMVASRLVDRVWRARQPASKQRQRWPHLRRAYGSRYYCLSRAFELAQGDD